MNNKEKLVQLSISIPIALKAITLDKVQFDHLYAGNVYFNLLSQLQSEMEKDFVNIKQDLFNKYGLILQKQSVKKYRWVNKNNSGTIEYSNEQLKDMTTDTIRYYLHKIDESKLAPIDKEWKVKDLPLPDISSLE